MFLQYRTKTSFPIAQLVERLTVNQNVPGSSPGRGAKSLICELSSVLSEIELTPRICSKGPVWGMHPVHCLF